MRSSYLAPLFYTFRVGRRPTVRCPSATDHHRNTAALGVRLLFSTDHRHDAIVRRATFCVRLFFSTEPLRRDHRRQTMALIIKPDTFNNNLEALWQAFGIRDPKKYGN